jgi:hypothetical protein
MIFRLLFSFLVAGLAGFLLIGIFWSATRRVSSFSLLRWALSAGFGIGISSCFFFLWLLVFGQAGYGGGEMAILVCLAALYFLSNKDRIAGRGKDSRSLPLGSSRLRQTLAFSFYGALGCAFIAFILFSLAAPHGGWDGWSIWNLRARFLFRGGEGWREGFSALLNWSHPDYPLLLSGSVARSWKYAGIETTLAPALISSLFTFATIGLGASSISGLRGKTQGYLAGLVLVGTHFLVRDGASQYADVPLGFYFLATIVLLSYRGRTSSDGSLTILAGTAAGLSAWTKNEGILFLVAIVVTQLAATGFTRNWKIKIRTIFSFSAGLLPVLIVILLFKFSLAPANDLISALEWKATAGQIFDFSRYSLIAGAFLQEMIGFPAPVLAFYLLCLGITTHEQFRSEGTWLLLALGGMVLCYFFIYVVSYQNLSWHLHNSLRRLLLQLWPSTIFTFFLIVRTPEEAAGDGQGANRKNFLDKVFRL